MAETVNEPTTSRMAKQGIDVGPGHELGWYDTGKPGPLLILSAGMHGNEPAGVFALQRIFAWLTDHDVLVQGQIAGLVGNVHALQLGLRYIDRDLNRKWDRQSVNSLLRDGPGQDAEDLEQLELIGEFDRLTEGHAVGTATGEVCLLDLHTMSAHGVPFVVTCDRPQSKVLASQLGLPGIAGLEKAIPGTTLEYFLHRGFTALAVEGGQHDAPETSMLLEVVAWNMLVATGSVQVTDLPDLTEHRRVLAEASAGKPTQVTVTHRHGVRPEDRFEMLPGFANLQPVQAGQRLAKDKRGDILAPRDGWILLPLYQAAGSDGFFIGVEGGEPLPSQQPAS
jgi:hypothetical protein